MKPEDDTLRVVLGKVKEVPHAELVGVLLPRSVVVSLQLRRLVVRLLLVDGDADGVQGEGDKRGADARLRQLVQQLADVLALNLIDVVTHVAEAVALVLSLR